MAFLLWMRAKVIKEVNQVEESLMEAQDFTVRITNMPQLKDFQQYNQIELKAALYMYLT